MEKSHTIFWSGSDKKEAGVGFAIRNDLLNQSDLKPISINDRISTLRVMLKNDDYLTLITVYGPTMQRTQEEKEQFYEQLGDCLEDARNDRIVVHSCWKRLVVLALSNRKTWRRKHELKWTHIT